MTSIMYALGFGITSIAAEFHGFSLDILVTMKRFATNPTSHYVSFGPSPKQNLYYKLTQIQRLLIREKNILAL